MLGTLPPTRFTDRPAFLEALESASRKAGIRLTAPVTKAILLALGERDESAEICRDDDGNPEPDPELRDTESVPLEEPIAAYMAREVLPHVPDAWVDETKRDPKDGEVGLVGYEINFNRYFYRYRPPRPVEEIGADIKRLEGEIVRMLAEVTGGRPVAVE
jgi:type I restriction enzyme M protein